MGVDFKKAKDYVTRPWSSKELNHAREVGELVDIEFLKSREAEDVPIHSYLV
jgi:hypothetical protein